MNETLQLAELARYGDVFLCAIAHVLVADEVCGLAIGTIFLRPSQIEHVADDVERAVRIGGKLG